MGAREEMNDESEIQQIVKGSIAVCILSFLFGMMFGGLIVFAVMK